MPLLVSIYLLALLPDATAALAVNGLASESFRTRVVAAETAEALGVYALPALRRAADGKPTEAAVRAADLIAVIGRRADSARRVAPTIVFIERENVPLSIVLADLEKQSGYRFLLPGDIAKTIRERPVTVKPGGPVPFWTAALAALDQANVGVVGVGAPQLNPQVMSRSSSYAPPPPPSGPAEGFVPAVLDADRLAADRQTWQRWQDTKSKKEADIAALAAAVAALSKQAERLAGVPTGNERPAPAVLPPQPQAAPAAVINPGTAIYLTPRTDASPRSIVSGAVRVEFAPVPTAVLPDFARNVLPLSVTLTPEPKLGLYRVSEVRITHAVGTDGRAIKPLMVDSLTQPAFGDDRGGIVVRRLGGGPLIIQRTNPTSRAAGPPALPQAILRLIATDPVPAKIASISGVVVGVVKSDFGEAASTTDLRGYTTVGGEGNTTMRAVVSGPDDDGKYHIDLTVTYPYEKVTPAAAGKDEAVIAAVSKLNIPADQEPALALDGCLAWGVVVTDNLRRPATLVRESTGRSRNIYMNGERYYILTGRYTVRPAGDDPHPPAKVTFYATWPIPVEVPFTVTNVPVVAGIGTK